MSLSLQLASIPSPSPLQLAVLGGATIAGGLSAGVYYTFQTSVIGGLAQANDDAYVSTFQAINRVIINPAFMLVFFGAPVLMATGTVMFRHAPWSVRGLLIAGLALQVTTLAITIGRNVPLNDALEQVGAVSGVAATDARRTFESPWNRFNLLRTITATASFATFAFGALIAGRE